MGEVLLTSKMKYCVEIIEYLSTAAQMQYYFVDFKIKDEDKEEEILIDREEGKEEED